MRQVRNHDAAEGQSQRGTHSARLSVRPLIRPWLWPCLIVLGYAMAGCKGANSTEQSVDSSQAVLLAAGAGSKGAARPQARPQDLQACLAAVQDRFDPVLGDQWLPDPDDMYPDPHHEAQRVLAQKYASRIRAQPTTSSTVIAYARRGAVLSVTKSHTGKGCATWYEVQGGGFVCKGRDFSDLSNARSAKPYFIEGSHLPYRYAKLKKGRHPIFSRLPSRQELSRVLAAKAKKSRKFKSPVSRISDGLQFETVVGDHTIRGETLYQNAKGDWFLARDAKLLTPPVGHGVFLTREIQLPLAYVREDGTPIRCDCTGKLASCGSAKKHDVVGVRAPAPNAKEVRLRGDIDIRVPRDKVRLALKEPRPASIPAGQKWIHVRLSEQTLVAYEGNTPVFATIVATGAKGHETPPGTFRTQRKFISTTMRGQDDEFGRYTVSDVPWTLFYDGSFALHAAYWHDTFGDVRSHGCTNIPPNDARWLFHWSEPALPVGWHGWGGVREGTYVHVTQE